MSDSQYRAGFVAVVGRPNVGKSTLVNALIGSKVSIVTPKPQTTRHRILAIDTTAERQVIFVDTPGLHRQAGKAMNRLMNRAAQSALSDADLVLFVVDATRWTDEDADVLSRLSRVTAPVIAVINKVDLVEPKDLLLRIIEKMAARREFAEIIPVSALKGDRNLEALMAAIAARLPLSPPLYPADMKTDRSPEFLAAEVIREKLTVFLRQEVPYGLTVQVERYESTPGGFEIDATIFVERISQKGIVVGGAGRMLKQAGRSARLEIARSLGRPVHLTLWVKVRENWADSEEDLMRFGFEAPDG